MYEHLDEIKKWQEMAQQEISEDKSEKKSEEKKPSKQDVIDWLEENPNPSDDQVEAAAKEMGWSYPGMEEVIFRLASEYVKSMSSEE